MNAVSVNRSIGTQAGSARARRLGAAPAALLTLLLFAGGANAQSRFMPQISVDGFGALGVVHSTERGADFVENTARVEGVGFSNQLDPSTDSRLGGQATLLFGSKLTALVQVVVEQTLDKDYVPQIEWANISYAFTPDFSLRGGRLVMPAFFVSDARKVSYANAWVRPPVELYGMAPMHSLDGIDATYRRRLGEWIGSVNGAYGRTEAKFPDGTFVGDKLWNLNATFVRGEFTTRLAVATVEMHSERILTLFDGFRAFGPEGQAIADRYGIEGRRLLFTTAAVEYDPGAWFVVAELGRLNSSTAIGERVGGYVTGGTRWRQVTPYATYSRATLRSESSAPGLSTTGMPPEYAHAAQQLNAGLNDILNAPVQQNLSVGGRWDFRPGVALKAQLDFVDVMGVSNGTFINKQPGFEPGGSARLFSLATVFVF